MLFKIFLPVLKKIKNLVDWLRPVINLYALFLNYFPLPKKTKLRILQSRVSKESQISGKVCLWEPTLFQVNGDARVKNLTIDGSYVCLVEPGVCIEDSKLENHSIFTQEELYIGKEIPERCITISVDLEGGVGLAHASPKEFDGLRQYWKNSKVAAQRMSNLFEKYEIPITWAICGHLFLPECNGKHDEFDERDWYGPWFHYDPASDLKRNPDWYMPDFIDYLKTVELFEIGYHSFGHFDYVKASDETIAQDMQWAKKIRDEFDLNLDTFVFPYNSAKNIRKLLKGGFQNIRGYIGWGLNAETIQFDNFKFFCTSFCLAPGRISKHLRSLPGGITDKNYNYFTHSYHWYSEQDFELLEQFLKRIYYLRKTQLINIRTMGEVCFA